MKNANLVSHVVRSMAVVAIFALAACGPKATEKSASASVPASPSGAGETTPPVHYGYEVIKTWPHDPAAFTQGLVFRNGGLLESTGLNGQSTLREVEIATGKVSKRWSLPAEFFGEGLAVIGDRAFQLTWQNQRGFIYDADTFRREGEFIYTGEGWGLTTDGSVLILSDGTNRLRFLDPKTFQILRTVSVTEQGKPVERLNELEWINGEVFANVWQTDRVVRIDPATGHVRGSINFAGLLDPKDRLPRTDVLNGIAYDATGDRLFITGKNWPKIFEVRLKMQP